MIQSRNGRSSMRVWIAGAALAASLVAAAAAARSRTRDPERSTRDAYVLSTEDHWMSSDLDVDSAVQVREGIRGRFLWFRRSGRTWVVRDPATLDRAVKLFEPLSALEPEQDALRDRERALDSRESTLDSEEEEIEATMERLQPDDADADDDDDDDDDDMDATAARRSDPPSVEDERQREELERRLDELHAKQREIQSQQRVLEREERALDDREDRIERDAESRLWQLMDETVSSGIAKPAGEK